MTYSCLLARINIFTCAFSFAHAEECSMLSCRKKACIKMSKSNMGADNDRISEPFFFLSFFTRENFPIRAVVNTSGTSFADRIVMAVQPVDHTPTNIADDIKNKWEKKQGLSKWKILESWGREYLKYKKEGE